MINGTVNNHDYVIGKNREEPESSQKDGKLTKRQNKSSQDLKSSQNRLIEVYRAKNSADTAATEFVI